MLCIASSIHDKFNVLINYNNVLKRNFERIWEDKTHQKRATTNEPQSGI